MQTEEPRVNYGGRFLNLKIPDWIIKLPIEVIRNIIETIFPGTNPRPMPRPTRPPHPPPRPQTPPPQKPEPTPPEPECPDDYWETDGVDCDYFGNEPGPCCNV